MQKIREAQEAKVKGGASIGLIPATAKLAWCGPGPIRLI
jgi:NADH dehydrogenase (ubiquinone) 1 beta subcomplex subunit 7